MMVMIRSWKGICRCLPMGLKISSSFCYTTTASECAKRMNHLPRPKNKAALSQEISHSGDSDDFLDKSFDKSGTLLCWCYIAYSFGIFSLYASLSMWSQTIFGSHHHNEVFYTTHGWISRNCIRSHSSMNEEPSAKEKYCMVSYLL